LSMFERDVRSAVARSAREPYGDPRPALVGERSSVTLTRLRSGGLADAGSQSQRVGYVLDSKRWTRLAWPVVDAAPSTRPRTTTLLDAVDAVSMHYLDSDGQWRDVWPAANVTANARLTSLPRAIDVRVTVAGFGELRRVIELPNPLPSAAQASGSGPGATPSPGTASTP
ncbi:MAG: type II secretion system protein GspJ, partial [Lysobacterales bacterium]